MGRWRSAMDNAQLAVENGAKAVLALIGPVGRTHNPAPLLRQALRDGVLTALDPDVLAAEIVEDLQAALEQFAEIAGDLEV